MFYSRVPHIVTYLKRRLACSHKSPPENSSIDQTNSASEENPEEHHERHQDNVYSIPTTKATTKATTKSNVREPEGTVEYTMTENAMYHSVGDMNL